MDNKDFTKKELFEYLQKKLSKFDKNDVDDVLAYYDEIIMDKMSEGKSELDAVNSLGDPNLIVSNIVSEMMANKNKSKGINGTLMLLGVCSSPILVPIAIVFTVIYLVVYVVWASMILAFGASSFAGVLFSIASIFAGFDGIAPYLMGIGLGIIICGLFGFLTYAFLKYGWKLIELINLFFAGLIKKIAKKGNK